MNALFPVIVGALWRHPARSLVHAAARFFGQSARAGLLSVALLALAARGEEPPEVPGANLTAAEKALARSACGVVLELAPTNPLVRIETGMHTSPIWKMDVDAANRLAATAAGDDGSARLWDLRTGALLRTFRPPGGEGLNSIALSPDGRSVACGGWTYGGSIYIFNTSDGTMAKRIHGLPLTSGHLVYNHDGTLLAGTMYAYGVRVYRTSDYSKIFEDREGGSTSLGADFDPANRLVTCSGVVRLYGADFKLIATWKNPEPPTPYSVRFSPDGTEIAVAFTGGDHIVVLSGKDLSLLRTLKFPCGPLIGVAWKGDGSGLACGSSGGIREWNRAWAATDHVLPYPVSTLQALRDGSLAFGAANPAWGRLGAKTPDFTVQTLIPQFFMHQPALAVSDDGGAVQFSYAINDPTLYRFDLRQRQITKVVPGSDLPPLHPPRTSAPGMVLTDFEAPDRPPQLNGRPLAMGPATCAALAPGGQGFAVGAGWATVGFDHEGKSHWGIPVAFASRINYSGDGKVLIILFKNGTIRWYRASDRQELLTFFPHADRQRWVIWSPNGYYDCAPGAENLMGWSINAGANRAADYFPAGQFRNIYYRPDVIQQVLTTLDVTEAVHAADRAGKLRETQPEQIQEVIARLSPPIVELVRDDPFATVTLPAGADSVPVKYRVRAPGRERATKVTVRFNGRLVEVNAPLPAPGETAEVMVPLPAAMSGELAIFASHSLAESEPATLRIERSPAATAARRPNLYLAAIGVAHLQANAAGPGGRAPARAEGDLVLDDLPLADVDARKVAEAFQRQKGRLFGKVSAQILTNEKATAAAVRAALERIAHEASAEDVAIVFFSGHGVAEPQSGFYLATYEADPQAPAGTTLTGRELARLLEPIKARTLLALDTCHAGGALGGVRQQKIVTSPGDLSGLINQLSSAERGTVVFSSSAATEQSLDDVKKGGVFTRALCEALTNPAAANDAGRLTCRGLQGWLNRRVPELVAALVKGVPNPPHQTPTSVIPPGVPDFALARP